jgi:hypothetical protein
LQVHGYDGLEVSARDGYWAEPEDPAMHRPNGQEK